MKYRMGEEKIDQNIERFYNFIFGTLGCSEEDAVRIIVGVLKKRGIIFDSEPMNNNVKIEKIKDKISIEQIEKWAEYVRTHYTEEWKMKQTELINKQMELTNAFYEDFEKSERERELKEKNQKSN